MNANESHRAVRRVVVWKSRWLPISETFIRNQADSYARYTAIPMGFVHVPSPLVRPSDTLIHSKSRRTAGIRLRFLRLTGRSRALLNRLRRIAPDIIHAHFAGNGVDIAKSAARLGVPLVVTLHGNDVTGLAKMPGVRGARYRSRLKQLFERADLLIAVSEAIRREALALGAPAQKTIVHITGVPSAPEASRPAEPKYDVLFVGRLVEKKGVDDLLLALGRAGERAITLRCAVIGSGPLEAALRETSTRMSLSIDFLGVLPREEVLRLMRESAMLVVPSKTSSSGDKEGLPTVLFEAASVGLPVVGYRHSGIPEAVTDGVTGLLVEEGDVEALSRAIERVAGDPSLREELSQNASARGRDNFDIRMQTLQLEALYDRVIGK